MLSNLRILDTFQLLKLNISIHFTLHNSALVTDCYYYCYGILYFFAEIIVCIFAVDFCLR
jgi:hypothetical protein